MEHLHNCGSCGKYTMEKACASCNTETMLPRPPKFSLEDKYAELRREVKKEGLRKKGLY